MIDPSDFIRSLQEEQINFITGVPDSLLKDICLALSHSLSNDFHIIAPNEGSAIGLAIGYYLGSGHPALVYMQNAGLGNIINPIVSLADPEVYAVPMLLMIGWRGELFTDGIQIKDEPQHLVQGKITAKQLSLLGIPYFILDANCDDIGKLLRKLKLMAIKRSGPVALLVRKGTFQKYAVPQQVVYERITREAAIKAIVDALPSDTPIVSTTGMASRELFEIRKVVNNDHSHDFLTVGGMGHASQIAVGIAITNRNRKIVCIDGDAALLMHMGGLAISADQNNLIHVVINNGAHDSVGGQPSKGSVLQLSEIAKACGYKLTLQAETIDQIHSQVKRMIAHNSASFLEVKCRTGSRKDLGRPDRTPIENKNDFMNFIKGI